MSVSSSDSQLSSHLEDLDSSEGDFHFKGIHMEDSSTLLKYQQKDRSFM